MGKNFSKLFVGHYNFEEFIDTINMHYKDSSDLTYVGCLYSKLGNCPIRLRLDVVLSELMESLYGN